MAASPYPATPTEGEIEIHIPLLGAATYTTIGQPKKQRRPANRIATRRAEPVGQQFSNLMPTPTPTYRVDHRARGPSTVS